VARGAALAEDIVWVYRTVGGVTAQQIAERLGIRSVSTVYRALDAAGLSDVAGTLRSRGAAASTGGFNCGSGVCPRCNGTYKARYGTRRAA
jgi:hypothetical protein